MEDNEQEKKFIGTILLVIIAVSIVFIMFVGYYGLKINRGDYCKNEKLEYTNYLNLNSSFVLNNTEKYILQKYDLTEPDYKDLEVCFNVETENNGGAEIQIINEDLDVLGTQYINNQTVKYCNMINSDDFKQDVYLGLKCSNCDSSRQVKIKYDSSGTDTEQVRFITSKEVSLEDPLGISIIYKKSCKSVLKWLFEWYLFLISALALLVLLLMGFNRFREVLFDGVE